MPCSPGVAPPQSPSPSPSLTRTVASPNILEAASLAVNALASDCSAATRVALAASTSQAGAVPSAISALASDCSAARCSATAASSTMRARRATATFSATVGGGTALGGYAEVLDALSRISTIAKWFLSLASASAVLPCTFSTSGEAPAESKNSTTSTCALLAAAWSSV